MTATPALPPVPSKADPVMLRNIGIIIGVFGLGVLVGTKIAKTVFSCERCRLTDLDRLAPAPSPEVVEHFAREAAAPPEAPLLIGATLPPPSAPGGSDETPPAAEAVGDATVAETAGAPDLT